jgi:hypothetical protein
MKKSTKYSAEVRERAVRMVLDHQDEYDSQWAAIQSIAQKAAVIVDFYCGSHCGGVFLVVLTREVGRHWRVTAEFPLAAA